jgi:hypothetical protein
MTDDLDNSTKPGIGSAVQELRRISKTARSDLRYAAGLGAAGGWGNKALISLFALAALTS